MWLPTGEQIKKRPHTYILLITRRTQKERKNIQYEIWHDLTTFGNVRIEDEK